MRNVLVPSALAGLVFAGCAGSAPPPQAGAMVEPPATSMTAEAGRTPLALGDEPLRLVTLGDSYTAGVRARRQDAWPNQLVRTLGDDLPLQLAANLAESGKTSNDVIHEQLWVLRSLRPELVSLLVGVNDVIDPTISADDYRTNVETILDALLVDLPPERIFVVTSPDYTLTPHGGDYGEREVQRAAVHEANDIITEASASRHILVVDITPVSERVAQDPSLVAADGLHPSAKQYAGWVELIAPRVRAALLGP